MVLNLFLLSLCFDFVVSCDPTRMYLTLNTSVRDSSLKKQHVFFIQPLFTRHLSEREPQLPAVESLHWKPSAMFSFSCAVKEHQHKQCVEREWKGVVFSGLWERPDWERCSYQTLQCDPHICCYSQFYLDLDEILFQDFKSSLSCTS